MRDKLQLTADVRLLSCKALSFSLAAANNTTIEAALVCHKKQAYIYCCQLQLPSGNQVWSRVLAPHLVGAGYSTQKAAYCHSRY
jgi:hypothetical protein